jgi:pyrroline-5-carboxylate reductase
MHKTIGFIGCGNMGRAILSGILDSRNVPPDKIIVSASSSKTIEEITEMYHTEGTLDNVKVAENADILFLAVKPYLYEKVILEIRDAVKDNVVIIGMAAGVTIEKMEAAFDKPLNIVKIMPNTPVSVREGLIAMAFNSMMDEVEQENIISLLSSIGKVQVIEEKHMDVITGISGSSPAYVFMFIEAMADAAVKNGLPRKDAYEISAQAVLGAAKMVLETGIHPGILKDMVTSPGGTTIEAVAKLEEKGFRNAVISAVDACIHKSEEMSRK